MLATPSLGFLRRYGVGWLMTPTRIEPAHVRDIAGRAALDVLAPRPQLHRVLAGRRVATVAVVAAMLIGSSDKAPEAAAVDVARPLAGVTSYFEVLDAERQLFDSDVGLSQVTRNHHQAVVQLYRALGGGWREGST